MPPKAPPAPLLDYNKIFHDSLVQSVPYLFDLFVIKLWWVWIALIALAYIRSKTDRMEERRKTERRVRDEMEIREKITKEQKR